MFFPEDDVQEHGVNWEEIVPARDLDKGQIVVPPTDNPQSQELFVNLLIHLAYLTIMMVFMCILLFVSMSLMYFLNNCWNSEI